MDKILLKPFPKTNICIYLLSCFYFMLSCAPEIPHSYNPEKAKKIYTQQTQNEAIIKKVLLLGGHMTNRNMVDWNVYIKDRLPFMGIDNILDTSSAIYIGEYMKSKSFNIGSTSIYSHQIHTKFPLQNISYLYNQKHDTYYAWYPQEWGAYVLKNDSVMVQEFNILFFDKTKFYTLLATQYYQNEYNALSSNPNKLEWKGYNITNKIVANKNIQKYTLYSLIATYHFNLLADIVSEMDNIENTNSIINYLQNQCNFSVPGSNARCVYLVDSPIIDKKNKQYLYLLRDTCNFKPYPYAFLDIYEKISIAGLSELELIYPDFTKEKIPEIAEYAENTKPTFIYFKRAYRSGYSNEPYYYFIFYYIDFIPFMPPRLRDMQVVFPRRFGLS